MWRGGPRRLRLGGRREPATGQRGGLDLPVPHGYRAYVWVTTLRAAGGSASTCLARRARQCVKSTWTARGAGAVRDDEVPTLPQFLTGGSRTWSRRAAPATAASYRMCRGSTSSRSLGGKRLDKLTVRDVQTWLNRLRADASAAPRGRTRSGRSRCAAPAAGAATRSWRTWTIRQTRCSVRPCAGRAGGAGDAKRGGLVRVSAPRRAPSSLDGRGCAPVPGVVAERWRSVPRGYVLLLVLGLRRGEVLGLTWPDVDLAAGEARIPWQLQRVEGSLVRRRTKTAPRRRRFRCRTSAWRR